MNSIYAYDTKQTSYIVINRIYSLLESRGWSVKTLSDESDIPYETLKKLLNRKIENTSIHNIVKIATAFHCQIDYLVSDDTLDYTSFQSSLHTKTIWKYFIAIDSSCQFCSSTESNLFVPLYHPRSFSKEHSENEPVLDIIDIADYPKVLRKNIECGIAISSHCFHPIYQKNDILLIARERFPHCGEISVFIHNGNLYVRKFYSYAGFVILEPVNNIGVPITITDLSEWFFFGYVAALHRK